MTSLRTTENQHVKDERMGNPPKDFELPAKASVDTWISSRTGQRSLRREFISLAAPILQTTAHRLIEKFRDGSVCDLRNVMVVLPGSMAVRRLTELLAIRSEAEGIILYPPKISTIGRLPEQLYIAKFPFASELVQQLAWVDALRSLPAEMMQQIVPVPPAPAASQQWLELGKVLCGVHRETASERLDFAKVAETLEGHPDASRWFALAKVQATYLERLDQLQLWDIQTARLYALQHAEAEQYVARNPKRSIVVVGCVDLNATQRGFLAAIAPLVEVWIGAEADQASHFDSYGCLEASLWQDAELALPVDSLLVGDGPQAQAELVTGALAELDGRFHIRDITLGVPDPSIVGILRRELGLAGITARHGPGNPLISSEPAQLLHLVAKYVSFGRYQDFAALVRHPAVDNLVRRSRVVTVENWLGELDKYARAALPKAITGFVNEKAPGAATFSAISGLLNRWLVKLSGKKQRVSQWVRPLLNVLREAYKAETCVVDDPVDSSVYVAASKTCEAITSLLDVPKDLEPTLSLSEVIDWLHRTMASTLVPEPANVRSLEMLGWLDLALDDAPALIVSGIHDGVVPESVNADAFLPNGLRRQLQMVDNAQRFARDLYAMHVIVRTRQHLRVVVGRTDASGDPLVPSRLLMACPLAELPSRVMHLVSHEAVDVLPQVEQSWKAATESRLVVPKPVDAKPLTKLSVTAFRDYLACPYRFYLKHVLRLRESDDSTQEMDASGFGVLVHETLDGLGGEAMRACTDAEAIEAFLLKRLNELAAARFGSSPPPAVLIQIEQAEMRLKAFAPKQAAWAEAGWEIRHVEATVDESDDVRLGDAEHNLCLIGRIDRIDYNKTLDQWAIWDYKTSESAKKPISVHYSAKHGWLDLQLPLYRHLARKLGMSGKPTLGYISIPKQAVDTDFFLAEFSDEQLAAADEKAHEVAAAVVRGEFWTKDSPATVQYDDFARICQSGIAHVDFSAQPKTVQRWRPSPELAIPDAVVSAARRELADHKQFHRHFKPVMIRASAGTGKTFQLSNRLLEIILSGQDVDGILATTFTRKAAGEIMHRVLQRLAMACYNPKQLAELQLFCGEHTTSALCLAALRRVTSTIHRLRISTLDSFFAQIARTFSLELGLPPGWSTMEPSQEPWFQLECIGQMLDGHERKTLVELVRMLAKGESSRQVVAQVLETVGHGYEVYRNTTRSAWESLPLPEPPSESAVESALMTLENCSMGHKSADKALKKLALQARIGDWDAVIEHGIYKEFFDASPTYYGREIEGDVAFALGVLSDRAAAELLPLRRSQTLASFKVLDAYNAEYSSMSRQLRQLAFNDVAYYLAGWLKQSDTNTQRHEQPRLPNATLELRLDCHVRHLLLDEFQDTAPQQWTILEPMAKPLGTELEGQTGRSEQHTHSGSFFCVGDTKQAIYGWRGGVAEIFDSVARSVRGVRQAELSRSFRSSGEVIACVNQTFLNLPDHTNFGGCDGLARAWSENFPQHETSRDDLRGFVVLKNTPKVGNDYLGEERKVVTLEFVAKEIADLVTRSDASVGVLFRTNADVGRMIATLRQFGVDASQDGGNPLTDSAAVQLVLSLIHLADHPGDSISGFHLQTSPLAGKLGYHALKQPHQLAIWFRRLVSRQGLASAIGVVADQLASDLTVWDQFRLRQLIQSAERYAAGGLGRLAAFEETVERQREALPSAAQVKVMTIHKSKGLEFDAVFLPDLSVSMASQNPLFVLKGGDPCEPAKGVLRYMNSALQRKLPTSWQAAFDETKQRGVTESLCMLYVAMTRARRGLYMYARPTSSKPSAEFGSLLQSTLGDGSATSLPEREVYRIGDPEWYLDLPKASEVTNQNPGGTATRPLKLPSEIETAPARLLRVTGPARVGRVVESIDMADAFSHSHSVAASYGKLIHAFFEQVRWLEDYTLDRDALGRVAYATIDPEALRHLSIPQCIDDFEKLLTQPNIARVLSRQRYAELGGEDFSIEVDNERPISVIAGQELVAGSIDRLVTIYRDGRPIAAEIFDFKTDAYQKSLNLLWLKDRIEHHRPQMQLYAEVTQRLFGLDSGCVTAFLVMLNTDEVVDVELEETKTAVQPGQKELAREHL